MKRKRKERYRLWAAVAVLYAVVLPVSGLMGMTENRQNARMQSESVREVEPVNKQGAVKENEENPTGSETVFGELSLTAEQLDAAEAVFSSLESLDLEQAARLMDRTFWQTCFMRQWEEHGICTHHPALLLRSREKEWYLPCRERYFMVILKMESPGGNVWLFSLSM